MLEVSIVCCFDELFCHWLIAVGLKTAVTTSDDKKAHLSLFMPTAFGAPVGVFARWPSVGHEMAGRDEVLVPGSTLSLAPGLVAIPSGVHIVVLVGWWDVAFHGVKA